MKKLAFVIPWYGDNISGGAEAALRGLVKNLHKHNVDLEVITTCVKEFTGDWGKNFHKPGYTVESDIPVRRFEVDERDAAAFDAVNTKLMKGLHITPEEEHIFAKEIVNSTDLCEWLENHESDYSFFVFIPYMFGTTYNGIQVNPAKSIMIPCLHDESYAYMEIFKQLFPKIRGMIFNAYPEMCLAKKVYNLSDVKLANLGTGVDTNITGNASEFVKKYNIKEPFILYAGRKDVGKNINLLIQYFEQYKNKNANDCKLVLIGGGSVNIPPAIKNDVFDLGFIRIQDKYNAYAAATLLCQPSTMESFSIVMMESWLCKRPVLVHADCAVTKNFAKEANGGLYFRTYPEFEGCVNYILEHPEISNKMGELGCGYVMNNFSWDIIVQKYKDYFNNL